MWSDNTNFQQSNKVKIIKFSDSVIFIQNDKQFKDDKFSVTGENLLSALPFANYQKW